MGLGRAWRRRGGLPLLVFADEVVLDQHLQGLLQLGLRHLGKSGLHVANRSFAVDLLQQGAHVARQDAGFPSRLHQALGGLGKDGLAIHAAPVAECLLYRRLRLIIGNPSHAR